MPAVVERRVAPVGLKLFEHHFPDGDECVWAGVMGAGGASAATGGVDDSSLDVASWTPIKKSTLSTRIIAVTMLRRRRATASASAAVALARFSGGRVLGAVQRGSKAINRVATVRESGSVKGWSGSARINESNLRTAASAGIAARLAASSQGSTSHRANSDTTLSGMPLRPSPMGENRKALNSEPGR